MLSPNMVQLVWERLKAAGLSERAFANVAGLGDAALALLVEHLNGLLSNDPREWPVEVLTANRGLDESARTDERGLGRQHIEALRTAGFAKIGDLVDPQRVAWRYTNPPELAELPGWGSTTIKYLSNFLVTHGLLERR